MRSIDDLETRRDGRACAGAPERQRHHSRGPDVRIRLDDRREAGPRRSSQFSWSCPPSTTSMPGTVVDQLLIVLQREVRQRDNGVGFPFQLFESARARRREEESTAPTDVWSRASSGQSVRSRTLPIRGLSAGRWRSGRFPRNGRPFTSDTLLVMHTKLALGQPGPERRLRDVELVIPEDGPVETHVIQDVHHLSPGERLAIHDGGRDGGGRKIISAKRHEDWRLRTLEPPQHESPCG